jgi:hypothetical protein
MGCQSPEKLPNILNFRQKDLDMEKGNFLRKISFLKPGWWIIHFIGISIVYTLGHILWR